MQKTTHAKKSLGQYFLTCDWALLATINAANLSLSDTVLEIGPGTGVLTKALAKRVKKVIAVEKDEALARALTEKLTSEHIINIDIHEGDILTQLPPLPVAYKVVANIPYYLTARLLRLLLEQQKIKPHSITLMIQKEVAERITAKPPHLNLLAISVQVFGTPAIIAAVPASCFTPKPTVDSAIISISDISNNFFTANSIDPTLFFQIVRLGFSQKRKMLVNTLSSIANKATISLTLESTGIDTHIRAEQLDLNQWTAIISFFTSHSVIS